MSGGKSPPSVMMTLLILVGVFVFMAGLLSLYAVTGISHPAFGFLFLLYWAGMLRQDPAAYLPTIVGGIGGILIAVLLDRSMAQNMTMMVVQYSVITLVLFFYMRGEIIFVINNSMMLYMLIATIPSIDSAGNYKMMIASLILSAIYMGLVSIAARRVRLWRAEKKLAAERQPSL